MSHPTSSRHFLKRMTIGTVIGLLGLGAVGILFWNQPPQSSTLEPSRPTPQSQKSPTLEHPDRVPNSEQPEQPSLTPDERAQAEADQAWRILTKLDLNDFADRAQRSSEAQGLIGAPFSRWRTLAERAGLSVDDQRPIPTLIYRDRVHLTLRVREGFVIGAEVNFKGEVEGPEWGEIVGFLAGSSALGGDQDPMMMLDEILHPPPHHPDRPALPLPQLLVGSSSLKTHRGASVHYYLTLTPRGRPNSARFWLKVE